MAMDQIRKAFVPASNSLLANAGRAARKNPGLLKQLPKHSSHKFAANEMGTSAGAYKGKRVKKNYTVSAFGVDHAAEIAKFNVASLGKPGAALGRATKKAGVNLQAGAAAKRIKNTKVTRDRMTGKMSTETSTPGRLTRMQFAAGGIGQKAGESMVNNPLKTTAAIAGGSAAAGAGFGLSRKKS